MAKKKRRAVIFNLFANAFQPFPFLTFRTSLWLPSIYFMLFYGFKPLLLVVQSISTSLCVTESVAENSVPL